MYEAFPSDDAKDFQHGARFIPGDVTLARRVGQPVEFVQSCGNACCWYWEFKDSRPASRPLFKRSKFNAFYEGDYDDGFGEYSRHDYYSSSYSSGTTRYVPGQRIYHFDSYLMELFREKYEGKCPNCGNTHLVGATGEALKLSDGAY